MKVSARVRRDALDGSVDSELATTESAAVNSDVREVFLATQITTCFLYEAPLASDSTPAASDPSTEGILTKLPSDK